MTNAQSKRTHHVSLCVGGPDAFSGTQKLEILRVYLKCLHYTTVGHAWDHPRFLFSLSICKVMAEGVSHHSRKRVHMVRTKKKLKLSCVNFYYIRETLITSLNTLKQEVACQQDGPDGSVFNTSQGIEGTSINF